MSYWSRLQLLEEPFTLSPDPRYFYPADGHQRILKRLEIAIRLRRGLSVVLGDIGLGKTMVLRKLLGTLRTDDIFRVHLILDPAFQTEDEMLVHFARMFKVGAFRSRSHARSLISDYLIRETFECGRTVVVMIDEAQKMNDRCLEFLRGLLNYETDDRKLIQLAVFGQMELIQVLKGMPNVVDRIVCKQLLKPLDRDETGEMIRFRLHRAGYRSEKDLFEDASLDTIHEFARGYPRKVIRVCQAAMEHLVVSGEEVVQPESVKNIIAREEEWRMYVSSA